MRFNFEGDPRENQGKFKGKSKGTVKGRFDSHGKLKGNQKNIKGKPRENQKNSRESSREFLPPKFAGEKFRGRNIQGECFC